jgi:ParB family chromosome partitioning protein
MAKRFNLANIQTAATALAGEDRAADERAERARQRRAMADLERIEPRPVSTRQLNQEHVESLSESIAALGLIEPLVVDRRLRLVAGAHRLAAIQHLKESQPEAFQRHFGEGVPVWLLSFDAQERPEDALAVEVAENEHRRDYTREEALGLADRLRQAGYRDVPGRPGREEKALGPALQVVLGKSLRTVRRLLANERAPQAPVAVERGAGEPPVVQALKRLQRALGAYRDVVPAQQRREELQAIRRTIKELEGQLGRALDALRQG